MPKPVNIDAPKNEWNDLGVVEALPIATEGPQPQWVARTQSEIATQLQMALERCAGLERRCSNLDRTNELNRRAMQGLRDLLEQQQGSVQSLNLYLRAYSIAIAVLGFAVGARTAALLDRFVLTQSSPGGGAWRDIGKEWWKKNRPKPVK